MYNFSLSLPLAADANSKVGELTNPNTKDKVLLLLCKTVFEDNKMRKHTNGGGW